MLLATVEGGRQQKDQEEKTEEVRWRWMRRTLWQLQDITKLFEEMVQFFTTAFGSCQAAVLRLADHNIHPSIVNSTNWGLLRLPTAAVDLVGPRRQQQHWDRAAQRELRGFLQLGQDTRCNLHNRTGHTHWAARRT